MTHSQKPIKRAGRQARHDKRAAKPIVDPCPPGQSGGAYRPLTHAEVARIYDTALRLLAELGMGEVPDRLRDLLVSHGAVETQNQRVQFPKELVLSLIHI